MIAVYTAPPSDFRPIAAIAAIYVVSGDHLLLLQRAPDRPEPTLWAIPAGKLDPNETPHHAAVRELYEETSLKAEPEAIFDLYIRKGAIDYTYHAYYLTLSSRPAIHLSAEHRAYIWAPLSPLPPQPLIGGGLEALHHFLNWLKNR